MRTLTALALAAVLLLAATVSHARVWTVAPDSSGDAATIQAAIDSAVAGDEVVLLPGNYTRTTQGDNGAAYSRSMIVLEAGVDLRGQMGAAATVLDAEGEGCRVLEGVDVGAVRIEGLTIAGGQGAYGVGGGGILVSGSSNPTIANCVIRDNSSAFSGGGGISCGDATITDCEFTNNQISVSGGGGGIACGAARIERCVFRDNRISGADTGVRGGAVACRGAAISDCRFENNSATGSRARVDGGAISDWPFGSVPGARITRCVFFGNRAANTGPGSAQGAAIHLGNGSSLLTDCIFATNTTAATITGEAAADVTIEHCTIVGNAAGIVLSGSGHVRATILAFNTGGACGGGGTYECVDSFGNAGGDALCGTDGGGNLSLDPEFCAADPVASLSFALQSDSPCAPPQSGACGLIGAVPIGCDAVSVQQRSWTHVKSVFGRGRAAAVLTRAP